MQYAWTKQSAIYINVHTHIRVCQMYNIELESRIHDDYMLIYQHSSEPVRFTLTSALEFRKEGHQSRDTKIEISEDVLIQSR